MTDIGINMNCSSKKEHVTEIERFIRTFKERVRSDRAAVPFKQVYKLIIVHLLASAIFWINAFPPSTPDAGLSDTKYPGKLVLGTVVYYKKFCRLQPG